MTRTPNKSYAIYRYFAKEGRQPKFIKGGLTLNQAQDHCNREDTHKEGVWFEGYTEE